MTVFKWLIKINNMKQLFALGKWLWAACAESCIAHSGDMD